MHKLVKTILVLTSILLLLVGCGKNEPESQIEKMVPVEVMNVVKSDLNNEMEMTGEVVGGTEVTVSPKVSGKVAAVNVKVGQSVNKGEALFEIEGVDYQSQLNAAQAALTLQEINLEKAQNNYDRYKQLYDAQAISEADFEAADFALRQAEAAVEQAKAQLDSAKNNYAETVVTSPISGKIAALNIDAGEMASPQSPAVVIVSLDPVKVKLNLSENVIGSVSVGQKVDAEIAAIGKTLEGTISSVAPKIDNTTRAFPVEVQIPNKDGKILAGMVAKLKINIGQSKNALVIPADAVMKHNGESKVFVVENGVAVERAVTVGITAGDNVEIIEGLKENEQVIVTGNRLIGDGQKVKVINTSDKAGGDK